MKKIYLLSAIGILQLGFLMACAQKSLPREKPMAAETRATESKAMGKEPWQIEWDDLVLKAKKEGVLTIFAGIDPHTRMDISKGFKDRFDANLEWIAGRGAEITQRILTERSRGIYTGDVYMSGGTSAFVLIKPTGAFSPMDKLFILPEVKDQSLWLEGKWPFIDKDKTIFEFLNYPGTQLWINTNLVSPGEISSYKDLLNPKWKGKIVMEDPTTTGSIGRWARVVGDYMPELGWEYQRQLAKQEPHILRDQRMMAEWIARGKYPVGLVPDTQVRELMRIGAPVDFVVPKEGVYLASGFGNLAYFDKAPHPHMAQVFINWFLSKEGQELVARSQGKQSARDDIKTDYLDPITTAGTRKDMQKVIGQGKLLRPDIEDYEGRRDNAMKIIMEIWGPLVGSR